MMAASNAIASLWTLAKSLQVPLDNRFKYLQDIPYTIAYVMRKRAQVDNLYELPKSQRPTDKMIFEGTSEDIEAWLDKVFKRKDSGNRDDIILVDDIEQ